MAEYDVQVVAHEVGGNIFEGPKHRYDDGLDALNRIMREMADLIHLAERDGIHRTIREYVLCIRVSR